MNYDYTIIDVDPNKSFVKRALLYLAMLLSIVALALVILLILFERYLLLFLPAGMILVAAAIWFLVGKRVNSFRYHFTDKELKVSSDNRLLLSIELNGLLMEKLSDKSAFFNKDIIKLAFAKSRIVLKENLNDNNSSIVFAVLTVDSKKYLLGFDEYAIALVGGVK